MTDQEMKAYCREQIATITGQEQEAKRQLERARLLLPDDLLRRQQSDTNQLLHGLTFARQAYQDMADEIERHQTPIEEA